MRNYPKVNRVGEGRGYETLTALWLRLKGYRIHNRNTYFHMGIRGEIDMIASKGGILVFVEVKYRSDKEWDSLVSRRQQARLGRLAEVWMGRRGIESARFDVILWRPYKLPLHIKNAFEPNLQNPAIPRFY